MSWVRAAACLGLLWPGPATSQEASTRGDCSPAVIGARNDVTVRCFVNGQPIEDLVRAGEVGDLLDAIEDGLAADTIVQAFVAGPPTDLAGTDFFRNVPLGELDAFLAVLGERRNLNDRIPLGESAHTALFWLAARGARPDALLALARAGVSPHVLEDLDGGHLTEEVPAAFFPVLTLLRDGALSLEDRDVIDALLALSFRYPASSEEMPASVAFLAEYDLLERVVAEFPSMAGRPPLDGANVRPLCEAASRSDGFDWCGRIASLPGALHMQPLHMNSGGWPFALGLAGLMVIRDGSAVFLVHYQGHASSFGLLYVPMRGTSYRFARFQSAYGGDGVPCWNERLGDYSQACWRVYPLEQDLFDPSRFAGPDGWPEYAAIPPP